MQSLIKIQVINGVSSVFTVNQRQQKKSKAWSKLRLLNSDPGIPWLCVGDFNEITRQDEKLGGAWRYHNQMQLFRDVINKCSFMDLGFVGSKFTWARHFKDRRSIWERLDRGLANNGWFLKFPGARVHHLHCNSSDHCPLLIVLAPLTFLRGKNHFVLRKCCYLIQVVEKLFKQHGTLQLG